MRKSNKVLKILHLASFIGNIGDNLSHMGLHLILKKILKTQFEIDELEIRLFYKNYNLPDKRRFDRTFVDLANSYDLLIIGGGGFLDYWVKDSFTGTTLDINKTDLDNLTVPTIITSVGSYPHKDVPEGNVQKFHDFLKQIFNKKNIQIAFRCDGSEQEIKRLFGNEFGNITTILDNAFFYTPTEKYNFITDSEYVVINTTLDQLMMKNEKGNCIDIGRFELEMKSFIKFLISNTNYKIIFIPHIYQDIKAFIEILDGINDYYIRSRIIIAPYIQGYQGCDFLMSIYKDANCIIGMRFHSNVGAVALNKKLVSLAALNRVKIAMNYVNLSDSIVDINDSFKKEDIIERMNSDLQKNCLDERKKETIDVYRKMFCNLGFKSIIK